MKAALLTRTGPAGDGIIELMDVPVPVPGPGEVVIKVTACGVCRSNLHMAEGEWIANGVPARLPLAPGHEVVGRVDHLGEGVDWLAVGDRVGVQPLWDTCGRCEYCLTGREEICHERLITGEMVDGGYAEYMLAKAPFTHLLPDEIGDVEAAPLFCPGLTAYSAVEKAELSPAKRVAVFGIGGVGHMALQFALLSGAEVVAVTDGEAHGSLARELGATRVIDSAADDAVALLGRMGGVDASIVFAPADEALHSAVEATKRGGAIVLGVNAVVPHIPFDQEKRLLGTVIGSRRQMNEVLRLAASGKVHAVCESLPLDRAEDALTKLKNRQVRGRQVLVP